MPKPKPTKGHIERDGFPTFSYGEVSFGTNRGIAMGGGGFGQQTYTFAPDPHKDPWYNNKHQGDFYFQAAQAIIDGAIASAEWPRGGQVEIHKVIYTLGFR